MSNYYISDDEFARLVSEDVKNKLSSRQKQILMEEQNWSRWQRALLLLIENLKEQIENLEADEEADRNRFSSMGEDGEVLLRESEFAYTTRKTKISRFMFHVNRRLDDVTKLIETGNSSHIANERISASTDVNFYRKAIAKHRALLNEYDLEATEIDRALWKTLENQWVFEEINPSNI
jgi:hypothetical protein